MKMKTQIETVKLSQLKAWEDNPRGVKKDDYQRLVNQIKNLKVYKPLLVNQDYVVLGGNMRLKVFIDMGFEDCEVDLARVNIRVKRLNNSISRKEWNQK